MLQMILTLDILTMRGVTMKKSTTSNYVESELAAIADAVVAVSNASIKRSNRNWKWCFKTITTTEYFLLTSCKYSN